MPPRAALDSASRDDPRDRRRARRDTVISANARAVQRVAPVRAPLRLIRCDAQERDEKRDQKRSWKRN
jgi:hypothetical protein